jgi:hypothetical protein
MDYANSAGKKEADAAKRILCLIQWNASELIEKAASMKLIVSTTRKNQLQELDFRLSSP